MTQQIASGQFRNAPIGGITTNLADLGGSGGWTPGSTLVDQLGALTPTLSQRYSIIGYTISFQGASFNSHSTPSYGKPGKILGGLVRSPQPTQGTTPDDNGHLVPYTSQMVALPGDISLLTTLWDGTQDPMFPQDPTLGIQPPLVPTTVSTTLPIALALDPGEKLGIGLWLTPSLTKGLQLFVQFAAWTVNYDDGR